jgi:hypothetical protein
MPATIVTPPPTIGDEEPAELDLMQRGRPYIAVDRYLSRLRDLAQDKVYEFNAIRDTEKRMDVLDGVVGMAPKGERKVFIMTPFMLSVYSPCVERYKADHLSEYVSKISCTPSFENPRLLTRDSIYASETISTLDPGRAS